MNVSFTLSIQMISITKIQLSRRGEMQAADCRVYSVFYIAQSWDPVETLKQSQVYYELQTLPRLGPTEAIFAGESQGFLCDAVAT